MLLDDIRIDANRIRERRKALNQRKVRSSVKPIPMISAAEVEEPAECVDVAAEIKKIQEDLKRRNKGLCSFFMKEMTIFMGNLKIALLFIICEN